MSNACQRLYVEHSRMGFKGDPIARTRIYLILLSVCTRLQLCFAIHSQNPRLLVDANFQKFAGSFFDLLCSSKDAASYQPALINYFSRYLSALLPRFSFLRFDKDTFVPLLHQFHDFIAAAILEGGENMVIHYDKGIKAATRMIDFLHKVNKTKHWCSEESFYNQILCDHLDLKIDFISWKATYAIDKNYYFDYLLFVVDDDGFFFFFLRFIGFLYLRVGIRAMACQSLNKTTSSHSATIRGF